MLREARAARHFAAEPLTGLEGRAVFIGAEEDFRRTKRASAQNYAAAAVAHVHPQRHAGRVVLPEAHRAGLRLHAEALGFAPLARLLRVGSIGNQREPRHAALRHDAAPFQIAARALPRVAVNANGLRALLFGREMPAQTQIAKRRLLRRQLGQKEIVLQRQDIARVRKRTLRAGEGLPAFFRVDGYQIGKPRNHCRPFLSNGNFLLFIIDAAAVNFNRQPGQSLFRTEHITVPLLDRTGRLWSR